MVVYEVFDICFKKVRVIFIYVISIYLLNICWELGVAWGFEDLVVNKINGGFYFYVVYSLMLIKEWYKFKWYFKLY